MINHWKGKNDLKIKKNPHVILLNNFTQGHTIGAAMTGGMGGGGHSEPAPAQAPAYQEAPQQQFQQAPACQFELKQFIECTQTQSDISLCQGFNELLKNCKLQYGKFLMR